MRKSILIMVSLFFCTIAFALSVPACEASAVIVPLQRAEGNTLYIPLRSTAEGLGFNVFWDSLACVASIEIEDSVTLYPAADSSGAVLIQDDIMYVSWERFLANHPLYYAHHDEKSLAVARLAEADSERMQENLATIATAPRPFGGEAIRSTRDFLAESMEALGYELGVQEFEHALMTTWEDYARRAGLEGDLDFGIRNETNTFKGYNIIATKPALGNSRSADILVIAAHYDSVAWEAGVHDNGSGVATVMEIASLVKDLPSHVEVRFAFFDATTPGVLGSYNYVTGLEIEEMQRVVAYINYDAVASVEKNASLSAYTIDGEPNFLTEIFGVDDVAAMSSSDHISFAPLAIPTIVFSDHSVDEEAHVHLRAGESVASVDPIRLMDAANEGAKAVAWIMSDASPSYSRSLDPLDREHVSQSIDLSSRNSLSALQAADRLDFAEQFDMHMAQIPTMPLYPADTVSVWAAMVEWWGKARETHFIYREAAPTVATVFYDDAEGLIDVLNRLYQPLDIADGYRVHSLNATFNNPAPEELSRFLAWRGEEGNCFVLDPSGDRLLVSTYSKQSIHVIEEDWQTAIGEWEQAAWNRLEELLAKADMAEHVTNVTFEDDGHGGSDLRISIVNFIDWEDKPVKNCSVVLDAHDLLDAKGTLYEDAALRRAFLQQWVAGLFEDESQKADTKIEIDEQTGEIIYHQGSFYPDSYVARFRDAFADALDASAIPWEDVQFALQGVPITAATKDIFREQYEDPALADRYLLVDVRQAFLYYVTGEEPDGYETIGVLNIPVRPFAALYGEDYPSVIEAFFAEFPELAAIKAAFSEAD